MENDSKTYGPSRFNIGVVLSCMFLLLISSALTIDILQHPEKKGLFLGLAGILISAPGLIVAVWGWLTKRPYLRLTSEGLEYMTPLKKIYYPWKDVGPFSAHEIYIKIIQIIFLTAHIDAKHDAIKSGKIPGYLLPMKPDISLQIKNLKAGDNLKSAEELVTEINRWREKFGAPENNALEFSTAELDSLEEVMRKKIRNFVLIIIAYPVGFGLMSYIFNL